MIYVQLGILQLSVAFDVAYIFAVQLLMGTSFIDRSVK